MKTLKWGIVMLAMTAVVACNDHKNGDADTTGTDTMTTTTATTGMEGGTNSEATNSDNTSTGTGNNMGGNSTGSSTETSNMNAAGNTGRSGTGNTNNGTMTRRDTAGFASTGQYNSDIATPKPKNLDDKKYKKNPQAHTYGDTAPKARPQR